MYKLYTIAAIIILTLITSSFSTQIRKVRIYIEEYDYFFTPQKENCYDTIIDKTKDARQLRIFLSDCMGKLHLECYKGNLKIEEGDYMASLDLLKKYSYGLDGVNGRKRIKVQEYYQPLRTGEWFFYNKGKLVSKKIYKDGLVTKL